MSRRFLQEERYVLSSQMRRAAGAIALNMAEGSTGQSNTGFSRFVGYAIRSGIELVACLPRRYINHFNYAYENVEEIIRGAARHYTKN